MKLLAPFLFLAFTGIGLALPESDAPNTKDYSNLPRYEGAFILTQSVQKYGELTLQIGGLSAPTSSAATEVRMVEGGLHRTTYLLANSEENRRTSLEVIRNYEKSLKDAGFQILWSADQSTIRNGPPKRSYFPETDKQGLLTGIKDRRYLCAEKEGSFVALFVAERSWEHTFGKAFPSNPFKKDVKIPTGTLIVQLDVVDSQPMEEKMVVVKAEEMKSKISSTGRIALYGVHFDFNKTEIKPESEPTLEEMAKLLQAHPNLKLLVVGHTDNVGGFELNNDLSQRRAASVVKELITKYGIAAGRLSPHGAAFIAPVATNGTEEGRALNRRVELVEQ